MIICIMGCFESNNFAFQLITGVTVSLVVFFLASYKSRLSNYLKLYSFSGVYDGFTTDSNEKHRDGKQYSFSYSFWKNKIKLAQTSDSKGCWEALLQVDSANPYVCFGTYSYKNNDVYSGDWGTMSIWLNKSKKEILVESVPKNREGKGVVKYILKKVERS